MITAASLRERLEYDPQTGIFRWRAREEKHGRDAWWNREWAGKQAGRLTRHGYITIKIERVPRAAHRLAWLYVYGAWPRDQLDHVDRNRSNNAIGNLREADNSLQRANTSLSPRNTSGAKGVVWQPQRRAWYVSVKLRDRRYFCGRYRDLDDAREAYARKARELFGEFAAPTPS